MFNKSSVKYLRTIDQIDSFLNDLRGKNIYANLDFGFLRYVLVSSGEHWRPMGDAMLILRTNGFDLNNAVIERLNEFPSNAVSIACELVDEKFQQKEQLRLR